MLSNDYDYTIDKYLVPKIRLRCPIHTKEQAQFVCTEGSCKKHSVICRTCQYENDSHYRDHKAQLKNIDNYLVDIINEMENFTPVNRQILQEIYSQTPNLQKWQDDDEMHLRSVEKHIQAQKSLIDEEMGSLTQMILVNLDLIREKLYNRLDNFYRNYCDTFNKQKTSLNENFGLAKTFYLFINPSNLAAKLQSEMPLQASQFVSQLNKSIEKAKTISQNKQTFVTNFRAINQQLNKMTDNLPFYLPSDQMSQQVQIIVKNVEQFFNKNILFPEDAPPSEQGGNQAAGIQQQLQPQSSSSSSSSSNGQIMNQNNNNANNNNNNNNNNISNLNINGYLNFASAAPPAAQNNFVSNNIQSNNNNGLNLNRQSSNNQYSNNNNNVNVSNNSGGKKQFKISKNGKQMQLKNADQNINIKPVKKYQLEIPICSVCSISETHYALASTGDSKIKIFESSMKKMHTFPAHSAPITCVTKIKAIFDAFSDQIISQPKHDLVTQQSNINQGENRKKILIATCSQDMSVLIQKYDLEKQSQPIIYNKITSFTSTPQFIVDIQDGIHIAVGDSFGDIQVFNFHDGKVVHQVKGKHNGKILGIYLIKSQKKLIVASDDTISIWKYSYLPVTQSPVAQMDRLYQDNLISDSQLGRISCFIPSYRDNLCFLGNNDGEIIIYDLNSRRILSRWNAHGKVPVLDFCLFEFDGKRDIGTLLSIGLSDKQIKTWKITADDRNNFVIDDPIILDGNSINDDIQSKNKLQIVQTGCPKLVIANERDKELLLYNLIL
ncbi:hypothetical protein ABPG74_007636 [Tetrahymena malaccensis]